MKKFLGIINRLNYSRDFIRYNLNMAQEMRVDLHFLLILNSDQYPQGTPGITTGRSAQVYVNLESLAEMAEKTLEKDVKELKGESGANISTGTSAKTGLIIPDLERLLNETGMDMIVLNGEENVSIWSQSSLNMDIISNTDCPVWVIPHKSDYRGFHNIVYATDYNEEDLDTMGKLVDLTRRFSPDITALHITEDLDFEDRIKKEGLNELIRTKTGYDKIEVKALDYNNHNGDVGELISDFAALVRANLIVVLKENRHFLERIFKSSSTKKIIQHANIPVLVYHEDKQN